MYKHGLYSELTKSIKNNNPACVRCGSNKLIELHHVDGDRKNNTTINLIVLCKSCHTKEHNKIKSIHPEYQKEGWCQP